MGYHISVGAPSLGATPSAGAAGIVRSFLSRVGRFVLAVFQVTGETTSLMLDTIGCLGRAAVSPRLTIRQMAHIGVDSLALVIVTVGFSGMVLSLYTSVELIQLGAQKYVGGLVGLSVAREIAPVIAAIVVSARVGSAIAAELGTMVVTQQVEALRALATSPIEYLVVPRFVACVVMLPVLGVFANLAGIGGGYLVAVYVAGVHPTIYLDSLRVFVENLDLAVGLVKTVPFAIIISLVACHQGLYTKGGAAGVGRATTSSVVMCIMLVYVADFFLSYLLPR